MASAAEFKWPVLGRKDVDKQIHAQNLLKEARLLKDACNSTKTGRKARAIPSGTATPFLESIIAWFTRPDVVDNGQDALWKAIQQMQQDLAAQHKQQNTTMHKILSKGNIQGTTAAGPRSYSAVAGSPAPQDGTISPTTTNNTDLISFSSGITGELVARWFCILYRFFLSFPSVLERCLNGT